MKDSVLKYFGENEVTLFHEERELQWEEAVKLCPRLTKGWFELSKLEGAIRLEFIRDYWINSLPYFPHVYAFFDRFFSQVQEVGIVGVKGVPSMYYALESAFFIGGLPLIDVEIEKIKGEIDYPLPKDYLQFFRVHNGFSKGEDTGVFPSYALLDEAEKVQAREQVIKCGLDIIDPHELFPFYRSFGLDVYQCFNKSWYVDGQVGNVLCSLAEGTMSNYKTREKGREYLAFPSFLDWLIFYLEDV